MTTIRSRLAALAVLSSALLFSCETLPPPGGDTGVDASGMTPEQKALAELGEVAEKLGAGETADAERRLADMAAKSPEKAEYRILHASVLISERRFDEAIVELEEVLRAEPGNLSALFALAIARKAKGDAAGARKALDEMLAIDPDNSFALATYGDLMFAAKKWDDAEKYYDRCLAVDPNNVQGLLGKARILIRKDKEVDAIAYLDLAAKLDPKDPTVFSERGVAKRHLGDWKGAIEDFGRAIELAPGSAWYRFERARVYLQARDLVAALADLDEAVRLAPNEFYPLVFRAGVLEELGRWADALADYRAITKARPDYFYAYESIGVLSYILGDWKGAADGFGRAFSAAPERHDFAVMRAFSTWRAGDAAGAKKVAADAVKLVDRERFPLPWLMLRLLADQNDQTFELEIKVSGEKKLDDKSAYLFFLAEYWDIRGRPDLAEKYWTLVREMERGDTNEFRIVTARSSS
jgi:tetratricopeptide (TPR) repeat protein